MGKTLRFMHMGDLRLGAPLRGLRDVSPSWVDALVEALANAWDRAVSAALSNQVDFVVITGDAFDGSRPSYSDYRRFFDGLARLDAAGVPSYLIIGNRDPYMSWERDIARLPASATLLGVNGPEFALFEKDGEPLCIVGGRSYYGQGLPEGEAVALGLSRAAAVEALWSSCPQAQLAPFAVSALHVGRELGRSLAPLAQRELPGDIDYWACSHLREDAVLSGAYEPRIVLAGCLQGTSFEETGERGCYLAELSEGPGEAETSAGAAHAAAAVPAPDVAHVPVSPNVSSMVGAGLAVGARPSADSNSVVSQVHLDPIPTSSVVLQRMVVDVSACQTLADVRRLVQAELFHENGKIHCDSLLARIVLVGETDLHLFLVKRDVLEDVRHRINNAYPGIYCDALIDDTRPLGAARSAGEPAAGNAAGPVGNAPSPVGNAAGPFPSVVSAMAAEQAAREDVLINYVQSEFVKRGILVPGSLGDRVSEFNDTAERMVLDILRGDSQ